MLDQKRVGSRFLAMAMLVLIAGISSAQEPNPEVVLEAHSMGFYRPTLLHSFSMDNALDPTDRTIAQTFDGRLRYAIEWSGYVNLVREADSTLAGPPEVPADRDPGSRLNVLIKPDSTGTSKLRAVLTLKTIDGEAYYAGGISFDVEDASSSAEAGAEEILRQITGMTPPFRSRIACVERRPGNIKEIVLVAWDGGSRWPMTRDNSIALSPSWAPDGKRLVFCSFRGGADADLYIADMDERKIKPLLRRVGTDAAPAWSPNGKEIIFAGSTGPSTILYMVGADGSNLRPLTSGRWIDTSPSWAPTGREIVFMSDRSGTPQIYRMDRAGANVRRLTTEGRYNADPAWSPTGDRIVYVRQEDTGFQLRSMDPSGDVDVALTNEPGDHLDPIFSPDGMKITYSYRGKVWVMNADGSLRRPLLADGLQPAWSPIQD
ncbi:hypothetical protein KQI63_15295 [bacterium]|nr:hypothetical protein [bacterium]